MKRLSSTARLAGRPRSWAPLNRYLVAVVLLFVCVLCVCVLRLTVLLFFSFLKLKTQIKIRSIKILFFTSNVPRICLRFIQPVLKHISNARPVDRMWPARVYYSYDCFSTNV